MRIIRYLYERIAEVHCSCCMDEHIAIFDICKDTTDPEEALYITIKDLNRFSLKDRLRHYFYFMRNWKKYIDGEDIINHGILLHREQIKELYHLLIFALKGHNIIKDEDIECDYSLSEKTVPVIFRGRKKKDKHIEDVRVPFIGDDFVVSLDIFHHKESGKDLIKDITFGYKLNECYKEDRKSVRRLAWYHLIYGSNNFLGGNYEGFLSKENTIKLLKLFCYLKDNIQK